jgi:hypothetical protein
VNACYDYLRKSKRRLESRLTPRPVAPLASRNCFRNSQKDSPLKRPVSRRNTNRLSRNLTAAKYHRGVPEGRIRKWQAARGGGARGRAVASTANSDDVVRVHSWMRSFVDCVGSRLGRASDTNGVMNRAPSGARRYAAARPATPHPCKASVSRKNIKEAEPSLWVTRMLSPW